MLVEEAFHQYDADAPEGSKTSSFAAKQWQQTIEVDATGQRRDQGNSLQGVLSRHRQTMTNRKSERVKVAGLAELTSLLPVFDVVSLLVENYFDRIHWFVLLFHQDVFRQRFRDLYADSSDMPSVDNGDVGYLSVLLAVCAISLEHLSPNLRTVLNQKGVDLHTVQDKILSTLRGRLLDMLSLATLETVQTCVLLGTYYLNQGEPELAWPLCGCGLRIAQALNLHRNLPLPESATPEQIIRMKRTAEGRKRCWWAIYEVETLCSMIYGFPLSISDEDCDIEPLDAHDEYSGSVRGVPANEPTLLSYKCFMSKLSMIVRSAIKHLYGNRNNLDNHGNSTSQQSACLQRVVDNVACLDSRVVSWYSDLPAKLRLGDLAKQSSGNTSARQDCSERDSNKTFEDNLFCLQALTLRVAYENARILIHRPLQSFKRTEATHTSKKRDPRHSPFQSSINACRDAALQVSQLGSVSIFHQVSGTYAVAFVSLHLLTAGIALCIMTSLDPLSSESHDSKIGVHRLMSLQNQMKSTSIVAAQGLDILGQLMSLVMRKEMDKMFEFAPRVPDDQRTSAEPREVIDLALKQGEEISQEPDRLMASGGASPLIAASQNWDSLHAIGSLDATELETTSSRTSPIGTCQDTLSLQAVQDLAPGTSPSNPTLNWCNGTKPATPETMDPRESIVYGDMMSLDISEWLDNGFVGQDQGWIWDSNYGIS
ncbi:hypothetical protein AK830_g772 [Neonectria ditissima]|uniref:Xylanolytic transcriptional activator regulatory domain-containing protein n=1 Tax=Neonectria ditissima TaxID=78410 RepID=A0A0P7BXS7_9HYPO|nr:hypothetical protein AK830_g772 [Neonectria ditissima]